MAHKFHPEHMARLESDERRRRQPPEPLLREMGARAGWRLADIGCGPGFYALEAAALAGPTGRVYALDLQEPMLARVRERAEAAGLANITTLRSEESRLPLEDGVADAALVANVLHECSDPAAFLGEVRRILAPGGSLAVVEWRREPMEMGPPLAERMEEARVRELLGGAGFGEAAPLAAVGATHFGLLAPRA